MKSLRRAFLVILLIFLFFSLTKTVFDYQKTIKFYQSFKEDFDKEKKRKITLQTQILKNKDPNEIEKTIRNQLNLLKPDEISVIIPNPTPTPQIVSPTPPPIYVQWWKTFF